MMPLSSTDAQVLKLVNTPKLPASLFENTQSINISVLSVKDNQATILLAGQQVQTQTTVPLSVGQKLTAQPELVNGQLQLKLIPTNEPTLNGKYTTSLPLTTTTTTTTTSLPSWTNSLPNSAKAALGSLKTSMPSQISLSELLRSLNQTITTQNSTNKELKTTTGWQSFLAAALTSTQPPTAEKIQQSIISFNAKLFESSTNNQSKQMITNNWKKELITLINNEQTPLAEKQIAQGILTKTEQTQQMQTLHQLAGQAVLLQEIPINTANGLDSFTLEIDVPKPDTPEQEQQWKILIQLDLPQGSFTSRIQLDKNFNIRVQLWADTETLSDMLQERAQTLKSALQEQGLTVESFIIAQGKPQTRTEQPAWHQPLVDVHG
jgi:hypothetical protein